MPYRHLPTGLGHRPAPDRLHQRAVFGDRNELGWQKQPALRVVPADQRFGADRRATAQVDLGLVIQLELAAIECQAQAAFDRLPLDGAQVHVGRKKLGIVASAVLGVVHRQVGILDQGFRVLPVGRVKADADTGRHVQSVAGDVMRFGQRGDDLVGAFCRVNGLSDFGQHDDEFIAANPAHGVRVAHAGDQALRHRLQQQVAGAVPERIIDVLEMVQIEKQHRQVGPAAAGEHDGLRQPVDQQHPVRQVGEEIMLRQIGHLARQFARLADVAKDDHHADGLAACIVDRRHRIFDRYFGVVAPDQDRVACDALARALAQGQFQRQQLHGVAWLLLDNVEHLPQRLAKCFLTRPAGHQFGACVEIQDLAGGVGAQHGVADRL